MIPELLKYHKVADADVAEEQNKCTAEDKEKQRSHNKKRSNGEFTRTT